jgi:hypothetical protein
LDKKAAQTAHNRIVCAAPAVAGLASVRLGRYAPTPHSSTFLLNVMSSSIVKYKLLSNRGSETHGYRIGGNINWNSSYKKGIKGRTNTVLPLGNFTYSGSLYHSSSTGNHHMFYSLNWTCICYHGYIRPYNVRVNNNSYSDGHNRDSILALISVYPWFYLLSVYIYKTAFADNTYIALFLLRF